MRSVIPLGTRGYVETLPRRGYRFLAQVETIGSLDSNHAPPRLALGLRLTPPNRNRAQLSRYGEHGGSPAPLLLLCSWRPGHGGRFEMATPGNRRGLNAYLIAAAPSRARDLHPMADPLSMPHPGTGSRSNSSVPNSEVWSRIRLEFGRPGCWRSLRLGKWRYLTNSTFVWYYSIGTLAEMPLTGGAPRELLEHVNLRTWTGLENGWRWLGRREEQSTGVSRGHVLLRCSGDGWAGDPRVSPDGQYVAFADHYYSGSDGSVAVVDLQGRKKTLTPCSIRSKGSHGRRAGRRSGSLLPRAGRASAGCGPLRSQERCEP